MSTAELLWTPSEQRVLSSQMHAFSKKIAAKYFINTDYPSLHRWSIEHYDLFWREMWDFAEIHATKPATTTCTGEGICRTTNLDASRVTSTLTAMQLRGLVKQLPGNRFIHR